MSTPVRSHDDFLVFGAPVIGEAEIDEVVDSLRSGWLGTGPKVARFEEDFRQYKSSEFAVAVGSCTAALHLSLLAVGLEPGDEVITTPMTFCATINAIIHAGATPVLADIDPVSMNIDPAAIEAAITERTRVVLIVHFAGRSCDMEQICQLCERHNLTLIEDCAHAIETTWHGQPVGTFGELGCFSFYVTKNICTGEGGMILTANEAYAARLKTLALHGMTKDAWKRFSDDGYRHYYVAEAGFKYNMMDIQAALGIHQLKRVEENWQRRQLIWARYQEALADVPVTCPAAVEADTQHAV
ncbi:MAG: DegT/DnrJ/EryC1/StrS family aminotransferase, partial [Lentisphaeria bacterium]